MRDGEPVAPRPSDHWPTVTEHVGGYARAVKGWLEFLAEHDIPVFGSRAELRAALNGYVEHRLAGPLDARLAESSWNLHTGALSQFYDWAVDEGYASAVPFSYAIAKRIVHDRVIEVRRNLAKVRQAKPYTTIKYLEADFAALLVRSLEGLLPDGARPDPGFRGHNPGRNAAVADLVLAISWLVVVPVASGGESLANSNDAGDTGSDTSSVSRRARSANRPRIGLIDDTVDTSAAPEILRR